MTFVEIPDLKTWGSYGIKFVCFNYSPNEPNYDLYYIDHYAHITNTKTFLKPDEVNEEVLSKNLTSWNEWYITPEDKKYFSKEESKLDFIKEYLIKLKYSLSLSMANPVWFLQDIELHPEPISYTVFLFNYLSSYISLTWIPIFLLVPKNLDITLSFYTIWLILIIILFIVLWKSELKIFLFGD